MIATQMIEMRHIRRVIENLNLVVQIAKLAEAFPAQSLRIIPFRKIDDSKIRSQLFRVTPVKPCPYARRQESRQTQ